jgi:ArsR family transcriptional regulator
MATMFKALADPTRLRLLSHVTAKGCQDVCACDLTEELGITQPTVSHHMKKLVEAGLVTREQRGKWAHYSVVPEAVAQLRQLLDLS